MFETVALEKLEAINGGFSFKHVISGALFFTVGVGCLAVATIPGVNVVAAAGVAYLGSWGTAGGTVTSIYGIIA